MDIRKEANRLYWTVKGHLLRPDAPKEDLLWIIDSYTRRLWHNEEAYVHEEGFEEAWQARLVEEKNENK